MESIVSRMHRNAQRLHFFIGNNIFVSRCSASVHFGNNKVRAGSEKVAMVSIVWANTHITLLSSKSFGDLLASLVPVNLFGQRHSVNGDISLRRQRKPFLDALASLAFKLSLSKPYFFGSSVETVSTVLESLQFHQSQQQGGRS